MQPQCFVLKVNNLCRCDGCKKKLRKIQKIKGVECATVNAEQGQVTVRGFVDPVKVMDKLKEHGIHAEICERQGGKMKLHNHGSYKGNKSHVQMSKKPQKTVKFNLDENPYSASDSNSGYSSDVSDPDLEQDEFNTHSSHGSLHGGRHAAAHGHGGYGGHAQCHVGKPNVAVRGFRGNNGRNRGGGGGGAEGSKGDVFFEIPLQTKGKKGKAGKNGSGDPEGRGVNNEGEKKKHGRENGNTKEKNNGGFLCLGMKRKKGKGKEEDGAAKSEGNNDAVYNRKNNRSLGVDINGGEEGSVGPWINKNNNAIFGGNVPTMQGQNYATPLNMCGYHHGTVPINSYNQQYNQHHHQFNQQFNQQFGGGMGMTMNPYLNIQQWPSSYGATYSHPQTQAMGYVYSRAPPPLPPPQVLDAYTYALSDENAAGCIIM